MSVYTFWRDRSIAWFRSVWPNFEHGDIERSYMARRLECGMRDDDVRALSEFIEERRASDGQ